MDTADSSMVKKKTADSKAKGKETWIYTEPAWLIAVRERMLEFYSD